MAAGWLSALTRGAAPDDVLTGLATSGQPAAGWFDVIGSMGSPRNWRVNLALPRAGDARSWRRIPADAFDRGGCVALASPDQAAVWLVPAANDSWTVAPMVSQPWPSLDLMEADRRLRSAVLESADALAQLDLIVSPVAGAKGRDEAAAEWSGPPLPPRQAALAARAARLFMAVLEAPVAGHTVAQQDARSAIIRRLDPVVRAALEAAYSRIDSSRD